MKRQNKTMQDFINEAKQELDQTEGYTPLEIRLMNMNREYQELIHKQSLAIGLIMKHFPKDILSDQMGEDHDAFLDAIKG